MIQLSIHRQARTTREWKMNREIVNCVALKLAQRNIRRKCFLLTQKGRIHGKP
jgi:hypothetical protein